MHGSVQSASYGLLSLDSQSTFFRYLPSIQVRLINGEFPHRVNNLCQSAIRGYVIDGILGSLHSIDRLGFSKDVAPRSGSDKCLELAKMWLADCINNHPAYQSESMPPLPTRILDIGSSAQEKLKLVVTRHEQAYYVALSHC